MNVQPQWIAPTLNRTAGRDPLALQTITQDRIIPSLLPGILALSRRARYFAFHSFLLDEYGRRKLSPSNAALGRFVLAREYEYALAVEMCPRGCGSSPVGRERSGPAVAENGSAYERGESVESPLGGYGLYYRSPLADIGVTARAGSLLGETPTPVDVLVPHGRGEALAEAFRSAIADTSYFKKHFVGLGPIPRDVLSEYASKACLCRLDEFLTERGLLRSAFFEAATPEFEVAATQRRLSFALFLEATKNDQAAAKEPSAFREQIWESFLGRRSFVESKALVTAQWSALILKEYMQEALSSVWINLCRSGLAFQPDEGFTPTELRHLLRSTLFSTQSLQVAGQAVSCDPTMLLTEFARNFSKAAANTSLESLRKWARDQQSAIAGLAFLLVVCERLPARDAFSETDRVFLDVGVQRSLRQEGLLQVAHAFEVHIEDNPSLADTVEWAVRRWVMDVHERVAYSKLPNFTFRFRWENGRLRFYNLGVWPFDLADMRHNSLSQLSLDLGFWNDAGEGAQLTSDGERFVTEAFR